MSLPALQTGCAALLRWQTPQHPDVTGVRILRFVGLDGNEEDGAWEPVADCTGESYAVEGLVPYRKYRFAVAPLFRGGALSPEESWEKVDVRPLEGDATASAVSAVTNFSAVQDGGLVNLQWAPNDDGVTVGYEIRVGTAWTGGIFFGFTSGTTFSAPWWTSGAQTYSIRAMDAFGNYSAASGTSTITVKALEEYVLSATTTESTAFGGTKTRTAVSSGDLGLAEVGAIFAHSGTSIVNATWLTALRYDTGTYVSSWVDYGAVITERLEVEIAASTTQHSGQKIYDYRNTPIGGTGSNSSGDFVAPNKRGPLTFSTIYGEKTQPTDVLVEIDTAQDATPTADGYRRFIPGTYTFRQYRLKVTLTGDGEFYPLIDTLKIKRLLKNKKDEGTASVTADPGPTRVTFAQTFVSTPSVVVAVVGGTTTAEFVALAANHSSTGCDVRVYDSLGDEAFTGTIHWIACGT